MQVLCARNFETKQMETWESGAEKDLLQGQARRTGDCAPLNPSELPRGFGKAFVKARWEGGIPGFMMGSSTVLSLFDGDQSLGARSVGTMCSRASGSSFLPFGFGFRQLKTSLRYRRLGTSEQNSRGHGAGPVPGRLGGPPPTDVPGAQVLTFSAAVGYIPSTGILQTHADHSLDSYWLWKRNKQKRSTCPELCGPESGLNLNIN